MAAVLALLERIIAALANATAVLSTILGLTEHSAQEHAEYQIEGVVTTTSLNVANPTYGLSALHTDLAAVAAQCTAISAAITALGSPAQYNVAPTWWVSPTTPPTTAAIAAAVWFYNVSIREISSGSWNNETALTLFSWMASHALWHDAYTGNPIPNKPYYRIVVCKPERWNADMGSWDGAGRFDDDLPALDFSTVDDGDTVWSWLNREYPLVGFTRTAPNGVTLGSRVWYNPDGVNGYASAYVDIEDWELTQFRSSTGPTAPPWYTAPPPAPDAVDVPPVWPGTANVTKGSPHAITGTLSVTETCDGVIVDLTQNPTKTGQYNIGGATYFYGLGWIAFFDDEGDLEPWQYLGFNGGVFTPRTMKQAAGFKASILAGGQANITGWVKS